MSYTWYEVFWFFLLYSFAGWVIGTSGAALKEKKRIVIKIGSSSLTHPETGDLNLRKIEQLVRVLSDLRGQGREVILVSSGAIAAGRQALGFNERPRLLEEKQAFAAVGQARLMMVYQKLFAEYNQTAAQILMTKNTVTNPQSRFNAHNTFNELLKLGTIPIVNENDTISVTELMFTDNDELSGYCGGSGGSRYPDPDVGYRRPLHR